MEGKRPILLVEDRSEDILFIQGAFKAAVISEQLIVLRDGEQAVSYLTGTGLYADRQTYPLPALVLLDLDLPKINGFQVLTWLRSQPSLKHLPVIVLTMSAYHSDVQTAYLLGANSFLSKPVEFKDMVRAVRQTCDFWLRACRLPASSAEGELSPESGLSPGGTAAAA